jgi:dTDP-4-amino-4,6-dideoxygalactose transaminase
MDLSELQQFAASHKLTIIEDAAQAHGAASKGTIVGGSGRLTCFSFYPGKNLGAYGDGGAITGNDLDQITKLRLLRDHGSPAKYQHVMVGGNSRLDSLQAAVLSVKLRHLPAWNQARRRHARAYAASLSSSALLLPVIAEEHENVFHLFVVRTCQRDALQRHLASRGISSAVHYPTPLHLTPAYRDMACRAVGSLPVSEAVSDQILSLPMYPELSSEHLNRVVDAVLEFLQSVSDSPSADKLISTSTSPLGRSQNLHEQEFRVAKPVSANL